MANHLTDDGLFVLEAFVPSHLTRLRDDQYVDAEHGGVDHVRFDAGRHDPVTQRLNESHVVLSPEGLRFFPTVTRYAWPSELDLMARIAGQNLLGHADHGRPDNSGEHQGVHAADEGAQAREDRPLERLVKQVIR